MLRESVRTGQNQDVSIGAKPEETMEEVGGKNPQNWGDHHAECYVHPPLSHEHPISTFAFEGLQSITARSTGYTWYRGQTA